MSKEILLVIDMQNDFIDGSLGTEEAKQIVGKVIEIVNTFEKENKDIYYTKDTHGKNYLETQEGKKLPLEHCIKNTLGWEIPTLILGSYDHQIFEKETFGSKLLFDTLKEKYQDNLDTIMLVGLCTDICVISNAILAKAYFPNVRVVVDASATAGVTKELYQKALDVMKSCQIEIINA